MKAFSVLALACFVAIATSPAEAKKKGDYPNGRGWQAVKKDFIEVDEKLDVIDENVDAVKETTTDTNEKVTDIQQTLSEPLEVKIVEQPVEVKGAVDATVSGAVSATVTNFPATQDVRVTETVPVEAPRDDGRMTLNTALFEVPAGETEVFGPAGFQGLDVSVVSATGLDERVRVIFMGSGNTKLLLLGDFGSGIGQEDYLISLPEPIYVDQIEVDCSESATPCLLFVEVVGSF